MNSKKTLEATTEETAMGSPWDIPRELIEKSQKKTFKETAETISGSMAKVTTGGIPDGGTTVYIL